MHWNVYSFQGWKDIFIQKGLQRTTMSAGNTVGNYSFYWMMCDIITVKCCFLRTLMSPQECHHFLTLRGSSLPLWLLNRKKRRSTVLLRIDNILLGNGKWMWLCSGYQWIGLCVVLSHPSTTLMVEHSLCFCACPSKATLVCEKEEAPQINCFAHSLSLFLLIHAKL